MLSIGEPLYFSCTAVCISSLAVVEVVMGSVGVVVVVPLGWKDLRTQYWHGRGTLVPLLVIGPAAFKK